MYIQLNLCNNFTVLFYLSNTHRKSFWDAIKRVIAYSSYQPYSCVSDFTLWPWHLSKYSYTFGRTRRMPEIPMKIFTIAAHYTSSHHNFVHRVYTSGKWTKSANYMRPGNVFGISNIWRDFNSLFFFLQNSSIK